MRKQKVNLTVSLSSMSQRCECLSLFSFLIDLTCHFHFAIKVPSFVSGSSGRGIFEKQKTLTILTTQKKGKKIKQMTNQVAESGTQNSIKI